MSYRTILLHVNSHHPSTDVMRFAADVTEQFGIHLIGAVATGYPSLVVGDAYGGSGQYLQMMQQELEEVAARAAVVFEEECKRLGTPSYEARVITGSTVDAIILNSRYSDLVILEQPDVDARQPADDVRFIGDILLNVTRPVLVAPRSSLSRSVFKRVLVAWNGSNEAARAVNGALPLLQQAELVQVVVVNATETISAHGQEPGADLALYLTRHGVSTDVCNLKLSTDPAYAVFGQASEFGADLLVMGAYGHSRLREYILGGTTREVLRSMKMPVLMAH